MFFKIDFEKAFDSVSWSFIDSVLLQMNFSSKWRGWVQGVLSSARASVLVNGSPSFEFQYSRGVRQGDPLSPFLFIIAMEAFTCFLNRAMEEHLFKGLELPNGGPLLSHFMYADDVILVGEWVEANIDCISRLMRSFFLVSGLKINFIKSSLYGVGEIGGELELWASKLGCLSGSFPFIYLGLMVGGNMKFSKNWKAVIDLVENRLATWKASSLSFGGRIVLLKAVFEALPVYYFSLFKAPCKVIKKLDTLRRKFLWGSKDGKDSIHWVSWDIVLKPKKDGGLGLSSLRDFNHSLLTKWFWRFKTEPFRLWSRVISAFHVYTRGISYLPIRPRTAGSWKDIISIDKVLKEKGIFVELLFKGVAGCGSTVRFWLDFWIGNKPLKDSFESLYLLEKRKAASVEERIKVVNGVMVFSWWWKRAMTSDAERLELDRLSSFLAAHVSLEGSLDRWVWLGNGSLSFSVCSLRKLLAKPVASSGNGVYQWHKCLPLKVNVFGWRAFQNRLPTRVALRRRNIDVGDERCPFCLIYPESLDHIFTGCGVSSEVWDRLAVWCKVQPWFFFSTVDALAWNSGAAAGDARVCVIKALLVVTCWAIWKARNALIFNNQKVSSLGIFLEVKSMGSLWIRNRAKGAKISEQQWHDFNF